MLITMIATALLAAQSVAGETTQFEKSDQDLKDWLACATRQALSWVDQNERAVDLARVATESCTSARMSYSIHIRAPAIDDRQVDRLTNNAADAVANRVSRSILDARAAKLAK